MLASLVRVHSATLDVLRETWLMGACHALQFMSELTMQVPV